MARVTFYLPTELEKLLQDRAQASGKSVSAFITELVAREVQSEDAWSQSFLDTYGSWEGTLRQIPGSPPEVRDALDVHDE